MDDPQGALINISDTALEITTRLSEKRATLEEKMISSQLQQISALCLKIAGHAPLARHAESAGSACAGLAELPTLCRQIKDQLQELLKIINYDLNFLEQYFEYDFNARLQYEHRFVERLTEIEKALSSEERSRR